MTDDLTGLPNRRALERAMGSQGAGDPCSLVIIDLDHFKQVNDTLGHAAGDAALQHVSRIFKSGLRDIDLAARIGGEEFALWLPGTNLEAAGEVAERARRNAESTPWEWAGSEMKISCSLGVASVPETVTQVANLYTTADAALYRAKGAGRNRVELAT